jgi:hypothetical protein
MIRVTIGPESIDERRLQDAFRQASRLPSRITFGRGHRAREVIQFGFVGRLQISDDERDLFETEGDGPGESEVNILGVLFDAHFAVHELRSRPGPLETAFGPDWYSMTFDRQSEGEVVARTSARHWVVGTHDDWRSALTAAFVSLRQWILKRADYLQEDAQLRRWINGGEPPPRQNPFGAGHL